MRLRATEMVVDTDAIASNVRALRRIAAPAELCAVVKADGYGHGSVRAARAALAGGAAWLAVALVEEGVALRAAGIDSPILVLSEPPAGAGPAVAANSLTATFYSERAITELAATRQSIMVHLKVDTGMHRVGADPSEVLHLLRCVAACPTLQHTGTFTHLAVADDPLNAYTAQQLQVFDAVLDSLRAEGFDPGLRHAANSAAAMAHPAARYDLVRCGIAIYGQWPDAKFDPRNYGVDLIPAIRLVSEVRHIKHLPAGARISYGLTHELDRASIVATIPIGYADGLPRRLSTVGGEVLVRGRRVPIVGRVTMDQIVVDCGSDASVAVGDEVVLLGRQGDVEITAMEWATRVDTIAYEITCGVGSRVPRRTMRCTDGVS